MSSFPPTTLMTGSTTQIMIDIVDMLRGITGPQRQSTQTRLSNMTASVLGFASGCAAAALIYTLADVWCSLVPPLLGLAALVWRIDVPGAPQKEVRADPRS
jgi:uncharacterized membrane protein YoaK (UPF0700 family)